MGVEGSNVRVMEVELCSFPLFDVDLFPTDLSSTGNVICSSHVKVQKRYDKISSKTGIS